MIKCLPFDENLVKIATVVGRLLTYDDRRVEAKFFKVHSYKKKFLVEIPLFWRYPDFHLI